MRMGRIREGRPANGCPAKPYPTMEESVLHHPDLGYLTTRNEGVPGSSPGVGFGISSYFAGNLCGSAFCFRDTFLQDRRYVVPTAIRRLNGRRPPNRRRPPDTRFAEGGLCLSPRKAGSAR